MLLWKIPFPGSERSWKGFFYSALFSVAGLQSGYNPLNYVIFLYFLFLEKKPSVAKEKNGLLRVPLKIQLSLS